MKHPVRKLLMTAALLSLRIVDSQAAEDSTFAFYIAVPDTTLIDTVQNMGMFVTPHFRINGINTFCSAYNITSFTKGFPNSRYESMRSVWLVEVNSSEFAKNLKAAYPMYFPYYEEKKQPELLGYTPSDWKGNNWPFNTDYLEYIKARDAWAVTKGDPNVLIGITDNFVNTDHEDLANKIPVMGYNGPVPSFEPGHGTGVCGVAAGNTDDALGTGYPGVGFNCGISYANSIGGNAGLQIVSNNPDVRVLNASWQTGITNDLDLSGSFFGEDIYREMYENGKFTVAAAGNTATAWRYGYPASLDYVFSVTNIGWFNPYGSNFNARGVHQLYGDDTTISYAHNPRVDLMAPACQVGTLDFDPSDPSVLYSYAGFWGTSIPSPMVAGTAALMVSKNPCLTPYQIEYALKQSADKTVLNPNIVPENQKFAGRIGAGLLDAGNTLVNVANGLLNPQNSIYSCNNPATQTMYVEGVKINTICAPGYASNLTNPKLEPVIVNGTGPYTYRWQYVPGNTVTLSSLTAAQPEIVSSSLDPNGDRIAWLRLTVYDKSEVQKVATKQFKIKLTTANTWDLAMRDSYMDMLNEPNNQVNFDVRDWNVWLSQDIWNRQLQDGGTEHQDPEYFNAAGNFVYVRVHNVGCAAYTSSPYERLRLYWTKSSTGENWDANWKTTQVPGSALPLVPGGLEITANNGVNPLSINSLQPGAEAIISHEWFPPEPQSFAGTPTPTSAEVCLLARIETASLPPANIPFGMGITETYNQNIKYNVINNNNIVTRNLVVNNLNTSNKSTRKWVDIANGETEPGIFDVTFVSDKFINPHFAGDFSAVGTIKLYLGDLYDRWMNAGAAGSYMSTDEGERSVSFDGSTPLELKNLQLDANERFPISVEFALRDDIDVPDDNHFTFYLRQFMHVDGRTQADVYGNITFQVNTANPHNPAATKKVIQEEPKINSNTFSVFPNPATDQVSVIYMSSDALTADLVIRDVTGRKVYEKPGGTFSYTANQINVSTLTPGYYTITISNSNTVNQTFRFVKK